MLSQGFTLNPEENQLKVAPKSKLTSELREAIRSNKRRLLALVRESDGEPYFSVDSLYPLIGKMVQTTEGEGILWQVFHEGKTDGASSIKVLLDNLHPKVKENIANKETTGWRKLLVNLLQHREEDVFFLLSLILLQEKMVDRTFEDKLHNDGVKYLIGNNSLGRKRFSGIKDTGIAFLVLKKLIHHFTQPEGWEALEIYIYRTTKTINRPDTLIPTHDIDIPTKKIKTPIKKSVETISGWSVFKATNQLYSEGIQVSADTIHDWINSKKIKHEIKEGKRILDSEGLNQIKKRLKDRDIKRDLKKYLIDTGKTPEAAKKFIQRRYKAGKTSKEILNEIRS